MVVLNQRICASFSSPLGGKVYAMAATQLPDALWDLVEPFLPIPPGRPQGGRPRVTDRACLTGILSATVRTTEGSALLPAWGDGFPTSVFSPDGEKLYYLVRTGVSRGFGSGELWVCDLATGPQERLLRESPSPATTSPPTDSVVFSSFDADGTLHIWLARLDRRTPPAKLPPVEGRGPVFGPEDDVYFRSLEGKLWYLYEIKLDSGQIRKFTADQTVNSPAISPDGQWILSLVPATKPVSPRDPAMTRVR